MGDIATTPSEMTSFYHALFGGEIVSAASLGQMLSFAPLTTGFAKGTPYGFGLMKSQIRVQLKGVHSCGGMPYCSCFFTACFFHTDAVGHAGLDYGSGMPAIGYLMGLNVSYAFASNTGESTIGMNESMGVLENMGVTSGVCMLLQAVVHAQLPGYPPFDC